MQDGEHGLYKFFSAAFEGLVVAVMVCDYPLNELFIVLPLPILHRLYRSAIGRVGEVCVLNIPARIHDISEQNGHWYHAPGERKVTGKEKENWVDRKKVVIQTLGVYRFICNLLLANLALCADQGNRSIQTVKDMLYLLPHPIFDYLIVIN